MNDNCKFPQVDELVFDKVIRLCKNANVINGNDIERKSLRYLWLKTVIEIHLSALRITSQIDVDEDVKYDFEYFFKFSDEISKMIAESVASRLLNSLPEYPVSYKK